jgi:hypothetical protein
MEAIVRCFKFSDQFLSSVLLKWVGTMSAAPPLKADSGGARRAEFRRSKDGLRSKEALARRAEKRAQAGASTSQFPEKSSEVASEASPHVMTKTDGIIDGKRWENTTSTTLQPASVDGKGKGKGKGKSRGDGKGKGKGDGKGKGKGKGKGGRESGKGKGGGGRNSAVRAEALTTKWKSSGGGKNGEKGSSSANGPTSWALAGGWKPSAGDTWGQADSEVLRRNAELREKQARGEALNPEEAARAAVLLERSQRKQAKRARVKETIAESKAKKKQRVAEAKAAGREGRDEKKAKVQKKKLKMEAIEKVLGKDAAPTHGSQNEASNGADSESGSESESESDDEGGDMGGDEHASEKSCSESDSSNESEESDSDSGSDDE